MYKKEIEKTDLELIQSISDHDYMSYNKLFMRYYDPLCRYAFSIVKNRNDAEDIVQELFLNLWNKRTQLMIHTKVSFYLYNATRNIALNHIRQNNRDRFLIEAQEYTETESIEQIAEREEYRAALYNCINQLPLRCREILHLQKFEGLKQKEIAAKLNISIKTIKNQIWTSLQRLKICIGLKGF